MIKDKYKHLNFTQALAAFKSESLSGSDFSEWFVARLVEMHSRGMADGEKYAKAEAKILDVAC